MNAPDFAATIERFTGFGGHYDAVRPAPPAVLTELLLPMVGCATPDLIVDLGSGTGLASRYWSQHARAVIGVEPTAAMREEAERRGGAKISYREGYSHATGLPDGCADLVICSQALHWMEPASTFAEAARILRAGGLFAACDYDWPPATGRWEAEQAYLECMTHCHRLEQEHGLTEGLHRWDKDGHLARMQASGQFRFVRECLVHHVEEGGADRLVGLLLSQGHVQTLLKQGLTREDLHIDRLRAVADRAFGTSTTRWHWSALVRIGIR